MQEFFSSAFLRSAECRGGANRLMSTASNATAAQLRSSADTGVDAGFSAALLESMMAGLVVADSARRLIAINGPAEKMLGVHAEQLIGGPATALPAEILTVLDEAFAVGAAITRRPVTITRAENESAAAQGNKSTTLSVTTTVARNKEGNIASVLVELYDLGMVRQISANLEQLDRLAAVGAVTAGVAHDLKNALVAVRTFFDLLGAGEDDSELRAVAAGEIQRIERTVRQLLRGARRDEYRLAPASVHVLLQDALNLVRHELQTRSITLETTLQAEKDRVNCDERQLRHTLVNLLINAAEAMPSGGRLSISTADVEAWERRHIRVTIADTGAGIRAEDLPKIFSPFFTTKAEGTGLGLAISRRIVNAHNGAIIVESEPGKGTTFHVFLPQI